MFQRAVVFAKTDRPDARTVAENLVAGLRERGLDASIEYNLPSYAEAEASRQTAVSPDLLVTLGGDGTVLAAVHRFQESPPPILAVRMGRVSFLADTEPEGALRTLDRILDGQYIRDECFMLSNNVGLPDALNELRVGTMVPSQMADLELRIDGRVVARDLVDAVLVATPVGASAYALSAGGPVVDPRLNAMVIVPVCPLSSNFKPYVVPSDARVSLRQLRRPPVSVMVDGHHQKQVDFGVEVETWVSSRRIVFLRTGPGFYERLRRRLSTSALAFASEADEG